ncbi:MAG: hypothetical protein WAX04_08495, partial [Oscillospiraceae bacterium]
MSRVERTLFAKMASGKDPSDLKSTFLTRFGITARQFNACRVQIEGKIASIKELRSKQISEIKNRISELEKTIQKLKKQNSNARSLHQKKRRLFHLQHKLSKWEADQKAGKIRLCFGSKKLFQAQFNLEANGFKNQQEWRCKWQEKRNQSFFLMGSKDETAGNQSCTATIKEDSLNLRLRLPNALSQYGKYLEIDSVKFKYGHSVIVASLMNCQERNALLKARDPQYKECGQAISYRFKKDEKGWILYVSTSLKEPQWVTNKRLGSIGIDINADHLAAVETDRYGNPIKSKIIPLNTYGKSSDQTKALIGDVASELVQWASSSQKPLILEKLDFQKKKGEIKGTQKYARMLSSFAYSAIINQ